ncbi:MAG: undecaprenyl-phosphate glucose phosphotransferase [Methylococcales bacterium]
MRKQLGITFINQFFNPIVVIAGLMATTWYFQERFEGQYFVLGTMAFLIGGQLLDGMDFQETKSRFWGSTVPWILLRWFMTVGLLLLIGFAAHFSAMYSRKILFTWFVITPVALIFFQWLFYSFFNRVALLGSDSESAVIVGVNTLSRKLADQFVRSPLSGIKCKGFFDDRNPKRLESDCCLLGKVSDVAGFSREHNIQKIYIALPMTAQPRILALVDQLRDTTASVYFVPDIFMFDLIQANISTFQGVPIIAVCESPFVGVNGLSKRICDVILSSFMVLLMSPIMLLVALVVKLTSRGPVIFKQRRYGLDGHEIVVYKFRSMKVCEDGNDIVQAKKNDRRVTPFGLLLRKTSLDELPQLFNVLQGQMSLVGPRPHAVSHNEKYRSLIKGYMVRHKVKPGITGWAQVNGFRGETESVEKMRARIEYDLDYLRNWSLILDLIILFKTLGVVFRDRNAY